MSRCGEFPGRIENWQERRVYDNWRMTKKSYLTSFEIR